MIRSPYYNRPQRWLPALPSERCLNTPPAMANNQATGVNPYPTHAIAFGRTPQLGQAASLASPFPIYWKVLYWVVAAIIVGASIQIGVVMLVSYLHSGCSSSLLIFIFGIIGNFGLACTVLATLPVIHGCSHTFFLAPLYLFAVASLTGNIGQIITFSIKGNRHIGDCYVRKHLQGLMIGLSGIELFVTLILMSYMPVVRQKYIPQQNALKNIRN